MDNKLEKYYKILGVTKEASASIIEIARKRKLQLYSNDPIKQQEIEEAYLVLSNPEKRKEFEKRLNQHEGEGISTNDTENKDNTTLDKTQNDENVSDKTYRQSIERRDSIDVFGKLKDATGKALTSSPAKKIGKGLFVAGSVGAGFLVAGGIPGLAIGGVVGIVAPKIATKIKLGKLVKKGYDNLKLQWKSTEEVQFIEEYKRNLDDQIYDLLSKPHNGYELEIARLKYYNQIQLLQKRIEFKRSEIRKNGNNLIRSVSLYNLQRILDNAQDKFQNLEKYIQNYASSTYKKTASERKLLEKNNELKSVTQKLEQKENKSSREISKLEIKRARILKKRDSKARRLALYKNGISFKKSILVAKEIKRKNNENDFMIAQPVTEQQESKRVR